MLRLYVTASEALGKLKADISGSTAIEYGLLASGVALAIIVPVSLLGDQLATVFNDLAGDTRCVEVGSNCKK